MSRLVEVFRVTPELKLALLPLIQEVERAKARVAEAEGRLSVALQAALVAGVKDPALRALAEYRPEIEAFVVPAERLQKEANRGEEEADAE